MEINLNGFQSFFLLPSGPQLLAFVIPFLTLAPECAAVEERETLIQLAAKNFIVFLLFRTDLNSTVFILFCCAWKPGNDCDCQRSSNCVTRHLT